MPKPGSRGGKLTWHGPGQANGKCPTLLSHPDFWSTKPGHLKSTALPSGNTQSCCGGNSAPTKDPMGCGCCCQEASSRTEKQARAQRRGAGWGGHLMHTGCLYKPWAYPHSHPMSSFNPTTTLGTGKIRFTQRSHAGM